MKNVAIINISNYGSTGKIASGLHSYLQSQGVNSLFCYGRGEASNDKSLYRIDSSFDIKYNSLLSRLLGDHGCHSIHPTKRLLKLFEKENIDGVFLVNLHADYVNENMLLQYIAKKQLPVVYIMIDEYPFLGKCPYNSGCERYQIGCGKCPQVKSYPFSWFFDRSRKKFNLKKMVYPLMHKSVFVAPEFVLQKAKTSPLMEGKRLEIVDEAIDVVRCQPRNNTEIRKSLNIPEDKVVIVSVVPYLGKVNRKGGHYLPQLAKLLEEDERFIFVHVGFNADKQLCPKNYIPIGFVKDQNKLPDYYSVADLFVFPSLDDTMPNTCLEALACGSPLLCFNTSGMPFVADSSCGQFVEPGNVEEMAKVIKKTQRKDSKTIAICRNYALKRYDSRVYFERLSDLLDSLY